MQTSDLSTSPSQDQLVPAAITDTGCERELNEDRYAVVESISGLTWIVCDGMGGVSGGELAAQLAIDAMRRELETSPKRSVDVAVRSSILEANRVIVLRRQNPSFSSMGTTVVAATFKGSEISISHVGDSRAYLIREYSIQQLTHDHTLVQQMVDRGHITHEEALVHPKAHVLTHCLGSEAGLEVEARKYWLWETSKGEPTDKLLLCTDGLYSHVTDAEIATIVTRNSPQKACVELVELAKARGGFDNITIGIIPLAGQLKREPPVGFDSVNNSAPRSSSEINQTRNFNWSVVIVLSLILTFFSIVATTACFLAMM